MNIIQRPGNGHLYFHRNITDIIIGQPLAASVAFVLKIGTTTILSELYTYDSSGVIFIRDLSTVIESYFGSNGNIIDFTYTLTEGSTVWTDSFTAIRCDASIEVDALLYISSNYLTRCHREKRTFPKGKEYLSYVQYPAYADCTTHYRIRYRTAPLVVADATGTLSTHTTTAKATIVAVSLDVAALLATANIAANTVLSIDVWTTGTNFETAVFRFYLDRMPYRYSKLFTFMNCFGVLETFMATGVNNDKRNTEFATGSMHNYATKISTKFEIEKAVNSGFLRRHEMEWTDDLLVSDYVSLYDPTTNTADIVVITDQDKSVPTSNEPLFFEIKYRLAHNYHLRFATAGHGVNDTTFDSTFN